MNDLKTARWQRLRLAHMDGEPNCRVCGRLGRVVDHIRPRRLGGDVWDSANLQTLCTNCHAAKTGKERTLYRVLRQAISRYR